MTNEINIVIGSWGSYNECNERALGSKWLCLNEYDDWDEIVEELKKEGFELNGIDEELFVQDIENFVCSGCVNWDYVNPQQLFELLKKSGVLDDEDKYQKAVIYCDKAKICDGNCHKCDITDCENNPNYKEKEND